MGKKSPGVSLWSVKRLRLAEPTPIRGVHLQQRHRRPADHYDPIPLEVLLPKVLARVR
jgi:hypothetical protein